MGGKLNFTLVLLQGGIFVFLGFISREVFFYRNEVTFSLNNLLSYMILLH